MKKLLFKVVPYTTIMDLIPFTRIEEPVELELSMGEATTAMNKASIYLVENGNETLIDSLAMLNEVFEKDVEVLAAPAEVVVEEAPVVEEVKEPEPEVVEEVVEEVTTVEDKSEETDAKVEEVKEEAPVKKTTRKSTRKK